MTDIRKYYDEDFGTFVMHPEAKLMQARSKAVEDEGIAKAGQVLFLGAVVEGLSGTFVEFGKGRLYWPQGQSSPLCESDDGVVGMLKDPDMENATFGGDCASCPMLQSECKGRLVLMFKDESGEKFFIQASGRSTTPAMQLIQAAKRRSMDDPMKVEISSVKGGKYGTYAFNFKAL